MIHKYKNFIIYLYRKKKINIINQRISCTYIHMHRFHVLLLSKGSVVHILDYLCFDLTSSQVTGQSTSLQFRYKRLFEQDPRIFLQIHSSNWQLIGLRGCPIIFELIGLSRLSFIQAFFSVELVELSTGQV